ncbi:MAG: uroporphyrinogen decarboxylase family protein [Phycisphaerae bacterium]
MSERPLIWTRHEDLAIDRRPSVGRDEYLDYMTFRRNDRPLLTEIFGPIIGLKEQWLAEGASEEELSFRAFRYRCPAFAHVPVATGFVGGGEEQLIEDTPDHRIFRDRLGRTMKLAKGVSTLPIPLDWPVKTMDDWRALRPHYVFSEDRLAADWRGAIRDARAADCVVRLGIPGAYDEPRQLLGDAGACMACYDQPELLHDMLETFAATVVAVLDRVTREATVDVLFVHEDMAGRSGPMWGPAQVREFAVPYYRRVWELAAERGVRLFDQDSDGDMRPVMEPFLEAGVNCMHPFEPAAGMDIVEARRLYGDRLAMVGGLDKHVLRRGRDAIRAELEVKLPPLIATGGCMFGLDHRIPNGTPLENYRFYLDTAWEIIEREAGS